MLSHLGSAADAYPVQLESRFPHVLARMAELWGTEEMGSYFKSLIIPDRPNRQGFPREAAEEIFRLSLLHGSIEVMTVEDPDDASGEDFHAMPEGIRRLERRSMSDRRQQDLGPPPGYVERRITADRRATAIAEIQLSEEEWTAYFSAGPRRHKPLAAKRPPSSRLN